MLVSEASVPIVLYATQRSEIIVVPGAMYCCMIGRRVAASLRLTGTMNPTFVATSYPPKTHCSLTRCPTLYFLCTNKHSSISTVCPGPPMTTGFLIKYSRQISLQKFFQSTRCVLLRSLAETVVCVA